MNKRIVIVEDRPWVMKKSIDDMKKMKIDVAAVLYFANDPLMKELSESKMQEFIEQSQVNVIEIVMESFKEEVDKFYNQDDVVILMDYDLKGDYGNFFAERISVRYTKLKLSDNKNRTIDRIKFYTTSSESILNMLYTYFENQVIRVLDFDDGQVMLDLAQVEEVVQIG